MTGRRTSSSSSFATPATLAAVLLALGCGPSGPLILAAEGGEVSSEDGVFTLRFPPGALPEDTHVSIRALEADDWPVRAPSRFDLIGDVMQVEPAGLELADDAYAIVLPPDPASLSEEDGDLLAAHYAWSPRDEIVRPVASTRTVHLADGRVAVVGTIFELGTHWVGDRVPGGSTELPQLRVHVQGGAAARAVDETWTVEAAALSASLPHTLLERRVGTTVMGDGPVAPAGDGEAERWDATRDPEHGLHPYEVFGVAGARTELRAGAADLEPISVTAGAPLAPVIDALPGWRCDAAGEGGARFVEVDVITGASAGVVEVGGVWELPPARCD